MDAVAKEIGWDRYLDRFTPAKGRLNADYLTTGCTIELKIIEEEGLEKKERQTKLAKLYSSCYPNDSEIDISFEIAPDAIRREIETIVSGPIQTAVKKASKQIRDTTEDLHRKGDLGILIIVNNGYSYLEAEPFESLVVRRCRNDSSRIHYVFCVTVDYHQGDFDAYVFCVTHCYSIYDNSEWLFEARLRDAIQARFEDGMSAMMRDQTNPDLWSSSQLPISDITFEADGVHYYRSAPEVPDSRFANNET